MNIKDLLTKYRISQQELADFMGIPRGRVSMWVSNELAVPPKVEDARNYDIAAKFFSGMPEEKVPEAIKLYHIVAGNIELKNKTADGPQETIHHVVMEETAQYFKTPPQPSHGSLMEQSYYMLAQAFDRLTRTHSQVVATNAQLVTMLQSK